MIGFKMTKATKKVIRDCIKKMLENKNSFKEIDKQYINHYRVSGFLYELLNEKIITASTYLRYNKIVMKTIDHRKIISFRNANFLN